VALFLLGGLARIVQNVRLTYGNQQAMAQLQDAQRFAMTVITDVVQAAGYMPQVQAGGYVPNTPTIAFPVAARHPLYIAAPIISMFTALAAFAVIPFGAGWQIWHYHVDGEIANVSIALILIFALGSIGVYGAIIGGWASQSKYSLLGSMRTCAQLVSYEVSLALSVLGVVLMGQSLNLVDIVNKQGTTIWFFIPQLAGLLVFFFAMTAETSRPPFDLPEADTELVAGYHTEYGGMRWGLFQTAEYINMITLSGLAVTLFFGGWHGPYPPLGPIWFLLKVFVFVSVFIWIRASVPRLRYDQLMRFGWKVLLPVATINAVITALLVVWVS
jgi:NADH-quinone oxidoreductase subunit H